MLTYLPKPSDNIPPSAEVTAQGGVATMMLMYSDDKTFYHVWVLRSPIAWTQAKAISTQVGQPLILPCWAHRSLHVGPGVVMDTRLTPKNTSDIFLTSLTKLVESTVISPQD